jgi:hypothetical protein
MTMTSNEFAPEVMARLLSRSRKTGKLEMPGDLPIVSRETSSSKNCFT